jgi:hypothetical protein
VSVQDELDLEVGEPSKLTEGDVLEALYARYSQVHGNGQRYAVASQVRSHASFYARRTADFVAMDLWTTGRLTLHGHEVKVSRSDWLRELKDPSKAAEFTPYMNTWWVVVSDARIVRDGELPDDWGLMAVRGGLLRVVRKAPWREALPLPPTRLAALLRAVAQTAGYLEKRQAEREHAQWYRCHRKDEQQPLRYGAGFDPRVLVMCDCTQIPELGPCEHQPKSAATTGEGTS